MENISIIEKDDTVKSGRFPARGDRVSELNIPENPQTMKKSEYDVELTAAREGVLNDQGILRAILEAVKSKTDTGSVKKLAEIENRLVELCIQLSDIDIEAVIRQLNKKIVAFVGQHAGEHGIQGRALQEISTGKWNVNPKGVTSVINFVRVRTAFLRSHPEQRFILGFNSNLDATRAVDLIEVLFHEEGAELNLIQIKNTAPDQETIHKIHESHKYFVEKEVITKKQLEDWSTPEESDRKIFEETLDNQSTMFEKIFEICVNYESVDQASLIEMLGLGDLNAVQKAWVLDTYFDTIREQVSAACSEGYIAEENRDALIKDLASLRQSLISKSGIPQNTVSINSVNSIVATGSKVVSSRKIFDSKESPLVATMGN